MGSMGTVLPVGWAEVFFERADFEAAFRGLDGCDHFFAESLRGRIRSLQLHTEEAAGHFARARERMRGVPDDLPDLVRALVHEVFVVDNELLRGRIPDGAVRVQPRISRLPVRVVTAFPQIQYALDAHRSCVARVLLQGGDSDDAARIYRRLIAENPDTLPYNLAFWHTNLAAAQQGLGDQQSARCNIDSAGLAAAMSHQTLAALETGCLLHAYHRVRGEHEAADGWLAFVNRVNCPVESRDVQIERALSLGEY